MPRPSVLLRLLASAALLGACAGEEASPDPAPAAGARVRQLSPDLRVEELRPGLWLHTSWSVLEGGVRFPSNGLLVEAGDSLVLVDSAWGEESTERLLAWVDTAFAAPLRGAVVTHWHEDRASIAPLLRREIPVRAHPLTARALAERGRPVPDTLAGLAAPGSAVAAGGVEVFYPGPGHTPDNVLVWVPSAGTLFGGCAVREASATALGNTADADVAGWPRSIERALARYGEAEVVVPGHGTPGGADLLAHTRSLFPGDAPPPPP